MKPSTKRIILRIVHLVAVIPVLGYVYQPVAEAAEYQRFTQLVFIPVAILAGYWMYMGLVWAVLGAVSWVALNYWLGPQHRLRHRPARTDRDIRRAGCLEADAAKARRHVTINALSLIDSRSRRTH